MFNQMKQLYEMQKKAKEIQRQLEGIKIEKNNSANTLSVRVNASQKVEAVRIDTSLLTADKKENLEKSLIQLINEALEDAKKQSATQAAEMMKGLKGLNIPGL